MAGCRLAHPGWRRERHAALSPGYLSLHPDQDPQRLAQLASDIGWVEAAIASVGVDRVLADLRRAAAANPASTAVAAVLAAVTGQAHNLRPPQPVDQPGYILRQLGENHATI